MINPLQQDLDHILAHTEDLWDELRGQRIFITGGTGFFGCWLLESFCWANDKLGLNTEAVVLTRNPDAFRERMPHVGRHPAVRLHRGDVRNFAFLEGDFPYVVHAAADTSDRLKREDPQCVWDSIVDGTRHMLRFARTCRAKRFLLASSGAVYGSPPVAMSHIPEDYTGGPNPMDEWMAVAEGKRAAEMLCALAAHGSEMKIAVARAFAFVGPYLPLDVHYAVGNFIRDVLDHSPIVVRGDGTPYRSYLYTADMAIWLWTILLRGRTLYPYNVGSEEAFTIEDIARKVASRFEKDLPVRILQPKQAGAVPQRYVPSTRRAREELGLHQWVSLEDAIDRTLRWHRNRLRGETATGGIA